MSTMIAPATPITAPAAAIEPPARVSARQCNICWATTVTPTSIKGAAIHHKTDDDGEHYESPYPCIDATCHKCWAQHATQSLERWVMPKCTIHERCTLLQGFVRWLGVDPKLCARMETILLRRYLLLTPGIFHCTRPGCPNSFFLESYWCSTVTCSACKLEMCVRCKEPAHRGVCPQTAPELAAWCVTADCRSCPNCKRTIEKNDGCNHMTCSQCSFEFCWNCLVQADGSHDCDIPAPRPAAPLVLATNIPREVREPRTRSLRPERQIDRGDRPRHARSDRAERGPARRPGIRVIVPTAAVPVPPPVMSKKERKEKKRLEKAAAAANAGPLFDLRSLRRSVLV